MEYRVKVSDRALRDLARIHDFVQAYASESASWFKELEEAIYSLERYPDRGKPQRANKKRRMLLFGRKPTIYKIIYQVDRAERIVKVFHIRHGARA